jgi:hypothetical protein
MSEIYLAYKQTATCPAHRPSGGRRRRELGRPPWLSSAYCTSPCRARGGAPRRWRGELGQPPWPSTRRARARGEATPPMLPRVWPSGGTRRRRGARPAAMSERSRSSRSRRCLPSVPASGRAEEVDGSRSSAGRNGQELLDTPASLPRAAERRLRRRPEPCARRRGGWISPGSSGS